jgi:hypothetical protein
VLDESTHEWLPIRVARKLKAIDVIDGLSDRTLRGSPGHTSGLRPDVLPDRTPSGETS